MLSGTPEYFSKLSTRMSVVRPIQAVYNHVNDCWLPVNPELIDSIRLNLRNGNYDTERDVLIRDIKSDMALMAYCIRELKALIDEEEGEDAVTDPIEVLRRVSLDHVLQVLGRPPETYSLHRLSEMNELQARCLQHSMVSASVAELLSERYKIDPDLAYACGLFRHLGITLIAWNYPHMYQRLTLASRPNENLDKAISRVLGFSPSLLGIVIARQWGLSPELRIGMGDPAAREADQRAGGEASKIGEILEKICKIGEVVALVNESGNMPGIHIDWEGAKEEIISCLGANGLNTIFERVENACSGYSKILPQLFRKPKSGEGYPAERLAAELLENNTYIRHCPALLQGQLRVLYSKLKPGHVVKDNIDTLVNEIIPSAGFVKGCIYMVEPDTFSLVPRLAIGGVRLGVFKEVKFTAGPSDNNPVLVAFRSQTPLMENRIGSTGERMAVVTGAIGTVQRVGVLYLEVSPKLLKDESSNTLMYFRAIRQALKDCMNLY